MKISSAIRRLLVKWDKKGFSPSSINTGHCNHFAIQLENKFYLGRAIWGCDYPEYFKTKVDPSGHCFFKYGKKFYDSESPNGVLYPDELKYYQRSKKVDKQYWAKDKKQNRKVA